MPDDAGIAQFKQGMELLRSGQPAKAIQHFRQATELKKQEPYYLSFLGVSMARAQGQWAAAVENCKTALSLRRSDPQLYLNLAEVYISAGRRDIAVETLDSASRYCGKNERIRRMRGKLGKRRSPVLPFLDRANIINQSLGKLRHRMLLRMGKSVN